MMFTMRDIYINFNLNPLTKFTSISRSTKFKDILPLKHLLNDHKDHTNQRENSHKLSDETGDSLFSLAEIQ